jgi:hypothetical protein
LEVADAAEQRVQEAKEASNESKGILTKAKVAIDEFKAKETDNSQGCLEEATLPRTRIGC